MLLALQLIGGTGYFLQKVLLSASERLRRNGRFETERKCRMASWAVYIAGLPAWVFLFIHERNWIAATLEASGAPAMILGLLIAYRGTTQKPPRSLNAIAIAAIPFGFGYSMYDFGGFYAFTQWLETALVTGYLLGTYLLARKRRSGYLWYVLMHVSCGWLMGVQGYPWLLAQQAVSLVFIVDAYRTALKNQHDAKSVRLRDGNAAAKGRGYNANCDIGRSFRLQEADAEYLHPAWSRTHFP